MYFNLLLEIIVVVRIMLGSLPYIKKTGKAEGQKFRNQEISIKRIKI